MIKANFLAYNNYQVDSLYQWDIDRVLTVSGLNLSTAPEVHFSNANMSRAIVKQAELNNGVVSVKIPNSILQDPLLINAHIGMYEGSTFKVVEKIQIPVIAKARPLDYKIENSDEEIYSFEALKNDIANRVTLKDYNANVDFVAARIDNIIAHNDDTDGNTELIDARLDIDGAVHESAGTAFRTQLAGVVNKTNYQGEITSGVLVYNLFDGNYLSKGLVVQTDNETTCDFAASENGRLCLLKVKPNTFYHVKKYDNSDRFRIATSYAKPIDGAVGLKMHRNEWTENVIECEHMFTTGDDDNYLSIMVSNKGETPRVCVTEGIKQVDFIEYGSSQLREQPKINELDDVVDSVVRQLTGVIFGNLFDGNYTSNTAILSDNTLSTASENCLSAILRIMPNTHYYIKRYDNSARFRVGTCADRPEHGASLATVETSGDSVDFVSRSDARYLIIYVSNANETPRLCVTVDAETDAFIPYGEYVSKAEKRNIKYYFLDNIDGVFNAPDTVNGGSVDDETTLTSADCSVIYDVYDELVSTYPNYITKNVLGVVAGYDFNKYTFDYVRVNNQSNRQNRKIKIVLASGLHGYEQGAPWVMAHFFKLMYENTDDDILDFMKRNVVFEVVPVGNPYGFSHNQRKNKNGVDINRNFDATWSAVDDTESEYYSGASANSETETQLLCAFLESNLDADYVIDYHNIANGYPLYYLDTDAQVRMCNSVFSALTKKWTKEYSGFPGDTLLGYCKNGSNATFATCARQMGLNAFTLETPWVMPVIGSKQYDQNTIKTGLEVLVNTIAAILKSYR